MNNNLKNILIVGKTGSGKSTLANVLLNKNNKFEEVFKEGKYGVSQTKKVHVEDFENQGIKYQIIDTIGISDTTEGTKMSLDKVLYNLAKVGHTIKDGLSQIWLVTDGKSTDQALALYNLLKETVFDEDMSRYTTVIRTRFESFEEVEECEKDRQILIKKNQELKAVNKIIYVDNPSLTGSARDFERNKETREESRKILLETLTTYEDIYKPNNLDNLNKIIEREWKNKELLKGEINKKFIRYIRERGSNLNESLKDEIEQKWKELEEKELNHSVIKENELSRQIGKQIIRELKELGSYLPEFIEWKNKINNLDENDVREEERRLINHFIIDQKNIVNLLNEEIKRKKKILQGSKDVRKVKTEELTKKGNSSPSSSVYNLNENSKDIDSRLTISSLSIRKSKKFLDTSIGKIRNSKFFSGTDYDEVFSREDMERICQAQIELTKAEIDLENIEVIMKKIENYKEDLEQHLEAKIEVL